MPGGAGGAVAEVLADAGLALFGNSLIALIVVGLIALSLFVWVMSALGTCISFGGFKARRRGDRIEVERAEAQKIAVALEGIQVKIYASSGADDRFYGSVTSKDIAEALETQHGIVIDRRKLSLSDPIKAYGSYTVTAKLYGDIDGKVNILVCKK